MITDLLQAAPSPAPSEMTVLYVLWTVLAGIGIFLTKVGLGLVSAVRDGTIASVALGEKIEKLCAQQQAANSLVHSQMQQHMTTLHNEFDSIREKLSDVIGEIRRTNGGGIQPPRGG